MKLGERFLGGFAELVIRHHKVIVGVGALLTVLSVVAMNRIELKTQVKDMMPADNPKVISFDEMTDRFAGSSSIIILLEGPRKAEMIAAAEDLAARIQASPEAMRYIRNINVKLDRDFLLDWGLLMQKPKDIENGSRMWHDINLVNYFRSLNDLFEKEYTGDDAEEDLETAKEENDAVSALTQIEKTVESLTQALGLGFPDEMETAGEQLGDTALLGDTYSISPDGSLLIFSISPNFPADNIPSCQALTKEIRRIQSETATAHPGISFGDTGDIPANSDEQDALNSDMFYPVLVGCGLLVLLFLVSFESIRSIIFMLACLVAGILFNYGILGLTVGEINMVTSILGALLVGMGIDYGIQVVTNYSGFMSEGATREEAIRRTFSRSGGGILLAALTTSAAFFVFIFSSAKALKQFGFVAGMGILTCFLSMTALLPSLLLWFGRKDGAKRRRRIPQIDYGFLTSVGLWSARRRRMVAAVAGMLVATAGTLAVSMINFEYDMMKLQPQSIPSNIGYRTLLDHFGFSSSSAAISLTSIEEAQELTERLEELRDIVSVSSISQYVASDDKQDERLEKIRSLRESPPNRAPLFYDAKDIQALKDEIQRLEYNIIEIGDLSIAGLGESNRIVRERNRMVREFLGAEVGREGKEVFQNLIRAIDGDSVNIARNLAALDIGFGRRMEENATRMLSADRRITAADLPESVKRDLFDESGTWNLLTAFPSDSVTRNSFRLLDFAQELDRVDDRISGVLPLAVMWMKELREEAVKMGILLAFLVFVMMVVSFRSLRYAILAMIPLGAGMILMFGLVALLRVQVSAFNVVLTPMVIGIGIAYGSYLLQRYIVEGKRLGTTLSYTFKAIFLSAVTTMIGFGSLWLVGTYTAIAATGALIFLGILAAFLVTLIILPALLGDSRFE